MLGVKTQTPNMAVLGELGRYPLTILFKERVLKYWLKIISNPDSIMFKMFRTQYESVDSPLCNPWVKKVKTILDDIGYSYLWFNANPNINYFPMLQKRIRDQFQQDWHSSITSTSKLDYYVRFKKEFKYEEYLDFVENDQYRKILTCFRLSSHSLAIETGRYIGTPRENRICQNCCKNNVESEYHFLMICDKYKLIRDTYLPKFAWPDLRKFTNLMSSKKEENHFRNL
jgi:hypothetical protein